MPLYEYQAVEPRRGCELCREPFARLRRLSDPALDTCPRCGARVSKLISAAAVGASRSGLDARAKNAGFHKLEKLGKGEYEKKY